MTASHLALAGNPHAWASAALLATTRCVSSCREYPS